MAAMRPIGWPAGEQIDFVILSGFQRYSKTIVRARLLPGLSALNFAHHPFTAPFLAVLPERRKSAKGANQTGPIGWSIMIQWHNGAVPDAQSRQFTFHVPEIGGLIGEVMRSPRRQHTLIVWST